MAQLLKSASELNDHMRKLYPDPSQYRQRKAMLDAYDFLTGKYDEDEEKREKLAKQIGEMVERKLKERHDASTDKEKE